MFYVWPSSTKQPPCEQDIFWLQGAWKDFRVFITAGWRSGLPYREQSFEATYTQIQKWKGRCWVPASSPRKVNARPGLCSGSPQPVLLPCSRVKVPPWPSHRELWDGACSLGTPMPLRHHPQHPHTLFTAPQGLLPSAPGLPQTPAASPALPSPCAHTGTPIARACCTQRVPSAGSVWGLLSLHHRPKAWSDPSGVYWQSTGPRWDSVSDSSQTALSKFPPLKCCLSISLCTVLRTSQYQQARKFQWCQRDLYLSEAEENPWEFSETFYLLLPAIIFYARSIIEEEKSRWHQLPSRKISRRNDTHCGTEGYFSAAGSSLGPENSTRFQGWTQIAQTALKKPDLSWNFCKFSLAQRTCLGWNSRLTQRCSQRTAVKALQTPTELQTKHHGRGRCRKTQAVRNNDSFRNKRKDRLLCLEMQGHLHTPWKATAVAECTSIIRLTENPSVLLYPGGMH